MLGSIHRSPDRVGGVSGILAMLLSLGGFALIGAAGFALEPGAPTRDVASAMSDGDPGLALAGLYLDMLGTLMLIVFGACLWSRLRRSEDEAGWVPTAVLGSVLAMVAAGLGDKAAYYAVFTRADANVDVNVATALYDTATGFFTLFYALGGLMLLLTGVAALRTGALSRRLGWAGVAIGIVAIVSAVPDSSAGQTALPLVVLWILWASVSLLRARTPVVRGADGTASAHA